MKLLAQIRPNIVYVNQTLEPIKKLQDKYYGIYFALLSQREEFLSELLNFKPLYYNLRLVKGYYINRYFKLPLVGKLSLRQSTNQLLEYKTVKKIPGNKFIKTYNTQLERYKALNVFHNLREEMKIFSKDVGSQLLHSQRLIKILGMMGERASECGYTERILVLDASGPNTEDILKCFDYLAYIKHLPAYEQFFTKAFLVFPDKNAFSIISLAPENKLKFRKVTNIVGKAERFEDNSEVVEKTPEGKEDEPDDRVEQTLPSTVTPTFVPKQEEDYVEEDKIKNQIRDEYLIQTGNLPGDYQKVPIAVEELIDEKFNQIKGSNTIDSTSKVTTKKSDQKKIKVEMAEKVKESILKDPEVQNKIQSFKDEEHKRKIVEARIRESLERQDNVTIDFPNMPKTTLKELVSKDFDELPPVELPDTKVLNKEVQYSKLKALNTQYQKGMMEHDIVAIFSSLSQDPSNPLFLKKLEKKDSSDAFNKVWTYTATYSEVSGKQLTFSIKMPKLTRNGYMFINGSKKFIAKQFLSLPVIKRKPDEVQVTSFYKKTFIQRLGQKTSGLLENVKSILSEEGIPKTIRVQKGDSHNANIGYPTSVMFENLSMSFTKIDINGTVIITNLKTMEDIADELTNGKYTSIYKFHPNAFIFGYSKEDLFLSDGNKILSIDIDQVKKSDSKTDLAFKQDRYNNLLDFILIRIKELSPEFFSKIVRKATGKKFVYSSARILRRKIAVSILLAFKDTLEKFLSILGVDYTFYAGNKNLDEEQKMSYATIRFKDGVLVYNNTDFRIQLLMNGLSLMDTKNFNFADFNQPEPYLDYFDQVYGTRNIGKGFRNFWERFVDPITKELLNRMNIPDDFTQLLIYASSLLEDNAIKPEVSVSNFRIRGPEMVTQALYQVFSDAFVQYKTNYSNTGGSSATFTAKDTAVLERLSESQNVESLTLLSPVTEVVSQQKCTFKGIGGINLDDSFTPKYRRFDPSMTGLFSIYTPVSSEAGVNRTLSYNAKVKDLRGFIDNSDDEPSPTQLLSIVDGINPFSARHSDFPRVAMMGTQQAHTTPSYKQSKPLIGSGMHKTIAFMIGDDFVFKAEKDGEVDQIDTKSNTVKLKYKDGTYGIIDIKPRLVKNTAGGFYIKTQLELNDGIKVGKKFKANDILAYDHDYFKTSSDVDGPGINNIQFCNGYLTKVALTAEANTFEDSVIVTEDMSENLAFDVVTDKAIVLGPNANVAKMVKVGDHITSGDPLIIFESSFDTAAINEVLKRLGQETGEETIELGRSVVRSKFSGSIVDIKIFYNRPIEEFSPSIKKILQNYIDDNKRRENIVLSTKTEDIVEVANTEMVQYDKLFGQDFDGIYIQFFVSHKDTLNQGDKLSAQVALKGIVGNVIPKELAPVSSYNPDKPVQLIVSPLSVNSRMTTDFFSVLYCNKAILGLKQKCKEIWES